MDGWMDVCMYVPADNMYNYHYWYAYQHPTLQARMAFWCRVDDQTFCIPSRVSESGAVIYTVVGFLSCPGFWLSSRCPS